MSHGLTAEGSASINVVGRPTPQLIEEVEFLENSLQDVYSLEAKELIDNPGAELEEPQPWKTAVDELKIEGLDRWLQFCATRPESSAIAVDEGFEFIRESSNQCRQDLEAQIELTEPASLRPLMRILLDHLDSTGILKTSIAEIARGIPHDRDTAVEPLSVGDLENARQALMRLEPPGIGAFSARQSLCFRIRLENPSDPALAILESDDHFLDLAANRIPVIAKALNIGIADAEAITDRIRAMDPFPIRDLIPTPIARLEPDIEVEIQNNRPVLFVPKQSCPRICINRDTLNKALSKTASKEERDRSRAEALRIMELRRKVIRRSQRAEQIARIACEHQIDALRHGWHRLKPLLALDVAKKLEINPGVVSRIVNNICVQLPDKRLVRLRDFFVKPVNADVPDDTTKEVIMRLIQEMVENENPNNPKTDSDIHAELKRRGYRIEPRYTSVLREEARILSRSQRKVWTQK